MIIMMMMSNFNSVSSNLKYLQFLSSTWLASIWCCICMISSFLYRSECPGAQPYHRQFCSVLFYSDMRCFGLLCSSGSVAVLIWHDDMECWMELHSDVILHQYQFHFEILIVKLNSSWIQFFHFHWTHLLCTWMCTCCLFSFLFLFHFI